jgi:hypothetical protein
MIISTETAILFLFFDDNSFLQDIFVIGHLVDIETIDIIARSGVYAKIFHFS